MIEQSALIVGTDRERAIVRVDASSGCQGCELSGGCGMGSLGRLFGLRNRTFSIENRQHLTAGDRIIIGLPENFYLTAAFLIYLLPLISLFTGALMANFLFDGREWVNVMASFIGLGIGLFLSARLAKKGFARGSGARYIRQQFLPQSPGHSVEPSADFSVKPPIL